MCILRRTEEIVGEQPLLGGVQITDDVRSEYAESWDDFSRFVSLFLYLDRLVRKVRLSREEAPRNVKRETRISENIECRFPRLDGNVKSRADNRRGVKSPPPSRPPPGDISQLYYPLVRVRKTSRARRQVRGVLIDPPLK